MKILLTGGSGFLGHALSARLEKEGHELVLPLRGTALGKGAKSANVTIVSVPDIALMKSSDWLPHLRGVNAVIHAAAIAHIGPSVAEGQYQAINHIASLRLAEAAVIAGVPRFIFVSSIRAQVGPSCAQVQHEASPMQPTEAYGASKRDAEISIRKVFSNAVVLRPALIVGDEAKGNLETLLKLAQWPIPLPFKSLANPQAMVCRDNLIEAVKLALSNEAMQGETYVVADEKHPSIADMVTAIRAGMGRDQGLFPIPRALLTWPLHMLGKSAAIEKITGSLQVDSSKLRRTGWQPIVTPDEALQALGSMSVHGQAAASHETRL
jgi:nucleoside-diphosphate-sugar epimerase